MSSPMSGKRTLDVVIGYCQRHEIETVPSNSVPCRPAYGSGVVRVGNIVFDCHRHDTGANVRGWILNGNEAYEFIDVPYWYSSNYTFNDSKWTKGAWDKAVEQAIEMLWTKADEHRAAIEAAKEVADANERQQKASRKAEFERQFQ